MKNFKLVVGISSLLAILVLAGCASKPSDPEEALKINIQVLRDVITDTVKDEERRNNLLVSTRSLESTLSDYNKAYTNFSIEYSKLNRNYDTPREKLEEIQASLSKKRKSTLDKLLIIHFEMVAQTSDEEWKRMAKEEWKRIIR
jgi:hypothetical protein